MLGHREIGANSRHRAFACRGCGRINATCPCFNGSHAEVELNGLCSDCSRKGEPGIEGPCSHPDCTRNLTHPCENCGRTWGLTVIKRTNIESGWDK